MAIGLHCLSQDNRLNRLDFQNDEMCNVLVLTDHTIIDSKYQYVQNDDIQRLS
jgi:hypothetical protein